MNPLTISPSAATLFQLAGIDPLATKLSDELLLARLGAHLLAYRYAQCQQQEQVTSTIETLLLASSAEGIELNDTLYQAFINHPCVYHDQGAFSIEHRKPLVLFGRRLFLWRGWKAQIQLIKALQNRATLTTVAPCTVAQSTFLHKEQQQALSTLTAHTLSILIGGPGSGKTTVIASLMQQHLHDHPQSLGFVLAPTGRAVARLEQALAERGVHVPAQTLHRFLALGIGQSKPKFHMQNLINADIVVIDECSMVSAELMLQLLNALPRHCQIILVGDPKQLSVITGSAFFEALCQYPPPLMGIAQLTQNHRVQQQNALALLTTKLQTPSFLYTDWVELSAMADDSMTWLQSKSTWASTLKEAFTHYKDLLYTEDAVEVALILKSISQQRVLCASHYGAWGVEAINDLISCFITQSTSKHTHEWFHGRIVMVEHNYYDLDLWNGDTGIALKSTCSNASTLRVYFQTPNNTIKDYAIDELPKLSTAFASTVHKAQGSEYAYVYMVLDDSQTHAQLLTQSLLFTAVTRAQFKFFILADATAIERCLSPRRHAHSVLESYLRVK